MDGDSPLDSINSGGVVDRDYAVPLGTDERHVIRQAETDLLKL